MKDPCCDCDATCENQGGRRCAVVDNPNQLPLDDGDPFDCDPHTSDANL